MLHRLLSVRSLGLVSVAVLFVLVFASGPAVGAGAETIEITILHTNDIHGHLLPFSYDKLGKPEKNVGGAARRAALIRKIRKKSEHPVIVMDAGDLFARGKMNGQLDFDVLNATPYDIMTLGNNEFKGADGQKGLDILMARIKQAKFPIVCANLFDRATNRPLVPPYTIINAGGIRIGVIGLTAPRVATYPQAKTLIIPNPAETAKLLVPKLREQCDFVIALTHIGYPFDIQLAATVPGIDVIIGGDSHTRTTKPTVVKETIICQAGEWGVFLGRLDLKLKPEGKRYVVDSHAGKLISINSSLGTAKDIEQILQGAGG